MGEEQGRKMGMPVETFTDLAFKGLASGKDQLIIGGLGPPGLKGINEPFVEIVPKRRGAFETLAKLMMGR